MNGHRTFDDLRARMSPERRARNDAAAKALLQESTSNRTDLSEQKTGSDALNEEINSAVASK
jgi:hypothetical protein